MNKHIMLVSNCNAMRNFLYRFLSKNYFIDSYCSGRKAIKAIYNEEVPDLIVCDLDMAALDGSQFVSLVRIKHQVPILILTSSYSNQNRLRFIHTGANEVLSKPFKIRALSYTIEELIKEERCLKLGKAS